MRRAPPLTLKTILLFTGLGLAGVVAAASNGPSADAGKRSTNSFNLYVTAAPTTSNGVAVLPSPGASVASGKAVITNPYNVPLIQNAGSLHPGR